MTNKTLFTLDMSIIKKYLKENNNINSNHINSPHLPKSKSYLKILGFSYILEKTNLSIISDLIKKVIKETHIFNNVILASKSCIIKTSSKSDIAVVWVDIWDLQNESKAKSIINQQFNIIHYITTFHSMNMNPGIPQYKNC